MKKISLIFMMVLCLAIIGGCSGKKEKGETKTSTDSNILTKDNIGEVLKGKHKIEIEIVDFGTIKAELDADAAPVSVTNFINLVNEKFYDGLTFHRIVKDFVIQGGDPSGDGTGGSEKCIKGEFINNGIDNQLSHTRGAIAMARAEDNDSATSQFYIVQKDATFLNGQYAVFGYVTEGIEIVDNIVAKLQSDDPRGLVEAEKQPTIKSIKVVK